uniref:Putative secreted protein n=1 Tax=Anopheles marajoara TaxID=58244 RepID=A0A2M4CE98_9DIPT
MCLVLHTTVLCCAHFGCPRMSFATVTLSVRVGSEVCVCVFVARFGVRATATTARYRFFRQTGIKSALSWR